MFNFFNTSSKLRKKIEVTKEKLFLLENLKYDLMEYKIEAKEAVLQLHEIGFKPITLCHMEKEWLVLWKEEKSYWKYLKALDSKNPLHPIRQRWKPSLREALIDSLVNYFEF